MTQRIATQRIMAFSGGGLDHRDSEREGDTLRAALREVDARTLLFQDYKPALDGEHGLLSVHPSKVPPDRLYDPAFIFLGRDKKRAPWFAVHLQDGADLLVPDQLFDLRGLARHVSARDLSLAGRAKSLIEWHASHNFCSNCGTRTGTARGGAVRRCPSCATEHYPRVSPVAIMLVEHNDSLLLGRQALWPEGSYSALAGFVSPGEDLEEACAREIKEEVGLDVTDLRYLMSQTWPFPSQLMLGLVARADTRELAIDTTELETARWFTRAEVEAVFAKTGDAFVRPPGFTIAHQMIRRWLEG